LALKVLNIVPSYYPAKVYGGVIFSSHITNLELSKKYSDIKISVSTSTANGKKRLSSKSFTKNFKKNYKIIYYFDEIINRFSFSFLFNVHKDIKNSDIVHFQDIFSFFSIYGIVCSKFFKKKILISPRGVLNSWSINSKKKILKKIIFHLFFKDQKYFWHATSLLEKKDLNLFGVRKNIFIIPNLILKKQSFSKKKLIDTKKKFVIGCLSRFDKKKGMDLLLKTLLLLDKKFILILAGPDFGYKEEILGVIKKYKLNDRVFVYDYLDNQKKEFFFNSIDLFALPSHSENFGNVYLESLLRGKPILTSFNTPFWDIEKYNCGVTAKLQVKDIFSKIIQIEKKIIKKDIKKNCQKYLDKFDKVKLLDLYKKMYDKIYK